MVLTRSSASAADEEDLASENVNVQPVNPLVEEAAVLEVEELPVVDASEDEEDAEEDARKMRDMVKQIYEALSLGEKTVGEDAVKKVQEDGERCANALPKNPEMEKGAVEHAFYPAHTAFRVYQKGLQDFRCKRVGDPAFFTAKRTWSRLVIDFPITEATKRRMLPNAFDGDARIVYEEVAGCNPKATADELWILLENRLCNKVHQAALQDRFFSMKWNERKEAFSAFAQRLRSAALALPGGINEDVLLNRLKAGLPTRLKDQANLITGSFDVVVSKLGVLSTAAQNREFVREVAEVPVQKPSNYSGNGSYNRFAHVICHYCSQRGHIARFCPKRKADEAAGNGQGGRGSDARAAPSFPRRN